MKGSYLLLIDLQKNISLPIGKIGEIKFKKGMYVYVGSALNGIEHRINRHMRKKKKIHWHIDYFLKAANIIEIFYKENEQKDECDIARILQKNLSYIDDFGCSDCLCKSHLFYGSLEKIKTIIDYLSMKHYNVEEKH